MKKQSSLDKCRTIFLNEVSSDFDTLAAPARKAERRRVVALFVSDGGAKENSANVYFTNIKKSLATPVAADEGHGAGTPVATTAPLTTGTPSALDMSYRNEDDVDPSSQNDFECDFSNSLANETSEELV